MRILHTSDWHLGRTFWRVDLHPAHRAFTAHFIEFAQSKNVDAVLISGDIYDRAVPPVASIELFDTTVASLLDSGIKVILSSGNHDSIYRLGTARKQLDRVGQHVRTYLEDYLWPIDLGECVVYGVPYLEPALVAHQLGVPRSHHAVLAHIMDRIRNDARTRFPGVPVIVLSHAFVTGSTPSESERELDIGGLGSVGAEVFDEIDYAALGHLHRPQTVAPHVVYSGSPLAFSFEEARYDKSVRLLTVANGAVEHTAFKLPPFVNAVTIRDSYDAVMSMAVRDRDALVELELTDPHRVPGALSALKAHIPGLIRMNWINEHRQPSSGPVRRTRSLSYTETFTDFISYVTGRAATEEEYSLFTDVVHEARLKESST